MSYFPEGTTIDVTTMTTLITSSLAVVVREPQLTAFGLRWPGGKVGRSTITIKENLAGSRPGGQKENKPGGFCSGHTRLSSQEPFSFPAHKRSRRVNIPQRNTTPASQLDYLRDTLLIYNQICPNILTTYTPLETLTAYVAEDEEDITVS